MTLDVTDPAHAPILWRTKLRSTVPDIDHAEQVAHCVDSGSSASGGGSMAPYRDPARGGVRDDQDNRAEGWAEGLADGPAVGRGSQDWRLRLDAETAGRYGGKTPGTIATTSAAPPAGRCARGARRGLGAAALTPGGAGRGDPRLLGTGSSFSRIQRRWRAAADAYLWRRSMAGRCPLSRHTR